MDKRTEKKVAMRLGLEDTDKFHEAMVTAEKDMLEEEDFVPLDEDPDMEIILEDESTED